MGRLVATTLNDYCLNAIAKPTKRLSVLLPTRGRGELSFKSLKTLWDNAETNDGIEYLIAVDDDDLESVEYYDKTIVPYTKEQGIDLRVWSVKRLGYKKLNEYLNFLGNKSNGHYIMFWNDDAIMKTESWDKEIDQYRDKFRVLRMPDQSQHPYSLFPIFPRKWMSLLGTISPQAMSDAWISQIAYLCNIMVNIPVSVIHDRFDLTGNNNDETYRNRPQTDVDREDPMDLNSQQMVLKRYTDCAKIMWYLNEIGDGNDHFEQSLQGKADPWKYQKLNDPNKLTGQL